MPRGRPKARQDGGGGITLEEMMEMRELLETCAEKAGTTPRKIGADLISGLNRKIAVIGSAMVLDDVLSAAERAGWKAPENSNEGKDENAE